MVSKKAITLIAAAGISFIISLSTFADTAPQHPPLITKTGWQLPNSQEISAYLQNIANSSANATLTRLGTSAGGRPVEALLVSDDPDFLKTGQPSKDRMTVMLLGSQHGNEPSGSEAFQILANRVTSGDLTQLTKSMNLVIVAMANPDGRDLASRYNAKKENPNIDYVLAQAEETRMYIDALNYYKPDAVYDAHESGIYKSVLSGQQGFLTDVDAQFEVGNNPNIDYKLRNYTKNNFLPELIKTVNDDGLKAARYRGEITQLGQSVSRGGLGITNMRNYAALQGALSVLVENRLDSKNGNYPTPRNIKVRVEKQSKSVENFLTLLARDKNIILPITRQAKSQWHSDNKGGRQLTLHIQFAKNSKMPVLDIPLTEIKSGRSVTSPFPNFDQIQGTNKQSLPDAYLINENTDVFRKLLDIHHIPYTIAKSEAQQKAITKRVASLSINKDYRQGIRDFIPCMKLETETVILTVEPGDLIIPTKGSHGVLAGLILNPESSNSIYQEGQLRGLLLSNTLPVKELI